MKVRTPKGETYRVRRRWLPWRRHDTKALDWLPPGSAVSGLDDDPISFIIGAILLIPVLLVLAVVVGEFLLLLLLLPFFVLARSIFGTPWVIEVTHQREVVHAEEVKGWGASQQRINDLVTATGQGDLPPGVEQRVRAKVRKARDEARNKVRNNPRNKALAKIKRRAQAEARAQEKARVRDRTSAEPVVQDTPGVQDTPRIHDTP
jgi:hypothetical protein